MANFWSVVNVANMNDFDVKWNNAEQSFDFSPKDTGLAQAYMKKTRNGWVGRCVTGTDFYGSKARVASWCLTQIMRLKNG